MQLCLFRCTSFLNKTILTFTHFMKMQRNLQYPFRRFRFCVPIVFLSRVLPNDFSLRPVCLLGFEFHWNSKECIHGKVAKVKQTNSLNLAQPVKGGRHVLCESCEFEYEVKQNQINIMNNQRWIFTNDHHHEQSQIRNDRWFRWKWVLKLADLERCRKALSNRAPPHPPKTQK